MSTQTMTIIWKLVKDLTRSGVTVILDTQYVEEADQPTERVAIIGNGKLIGIGTLLVLPVGSGGLGLALVSSAIAKA